MISVNTLRRIVRHDLAAAKVTLRLGQWTAPERLPDHDLIVTATYGQPWRWPLRYEICEIAYLELARYRLESFVVIDGDYVSLDPTRSGLHALYDVKHSVHAAHVGSPQRLRQSPLGALTDRPGLVRVRETRVAAMIESGGRYLRGLDPFGQSVSIYHGSQFTMRAVLPNVDHTDARPTLIEREGNVISILSGKICTAVTAAATVVEMASEMMSV
jgi:hypothetical protein